MAKSITILPLDRLWLWCMNPAFLVSGTRPDMRFHDVFIIKKFQYGCCLMELCYKYVSADKVNILFTLHYRANGNLSLVTYFPFFFKTLRHIPCLWVYLTLLPTDIYFVSKNIYFFMITQLQYTSRLSCSHLLVLDDQDLLLVEEGSAHIVVDRVET